MSGSAIVLERETANDESATVVKIYAASGAIVAEGDLIFDIENSKATQELCAPCAGILEYQAKVGDTVGFGVAIANIYSAEEWAARQVSNNAGAVQKSAPPISPTESQPAPQDKAGSEGNLTSTGPRFSLAATALLTKHLLDPAEFTNEFVVSEDVRTRLDQLKSTKLQIPSQPEPISNDNVTRGHAVLGSKRAEIEVLSAGAGETMLSVLGFQLGLVGITRGPLDFLDDRITDIVIYEAARLLKKFPNLNAHYANGKIFHHKRVHAGLAIDGGGRLVVYGIENADKISLQELSDAIRDGVTRYATNELTASELSRATFTVTDLSDANLDFVFPLLPRGQSCILGITRAEGAGFRIFAGFDHRVTEGREVGRFLSELRQRLLSFASQVGPVKDIARCAYCARSAVDVGRQSIDKGLIKVVDRRGHEIFCCASCWNGW